MQWLSCFAFHACAVDDGEITLDLGKKKKKKKKDATTAADAEVKTNHKLYSSVIGSNAASWQSHASECLTALRV
jgi:hypothetical protein